VPQQPPTLGEFLWPFLRRILIELGPVAVFFAAFVWGGIFVATGAFMAAAAVSVGVSLLEQGRLPTIPAVLAGIILVLGAMTLAAGDGDYIKVQPTVANGLFALTLAGARLAGYDLLERSFARELRLCSRGWARLSWRVVAYLAFLAVVNEIVWRSFSTDTWVTFKTFAVVPLDIIFALLQIPLVRSSWTGSAHVSSRMAA
jgi:intracellular septation protein